MPDNTPSFPPEFAAAYKVAQGKYYTPKTARINPEHAILTHEWEVGITNATSKRPVIGTDAVASCTCVILYNKKTKTAVVGHNPRLDEDDYKKLIAKVRKNDDEMIEVHVSGAPMCKSEEDNENSDTIKYLNVLAKAIAATPNAQLKTFDVYDKPKPVGMAIDSRNGKLIRGTELLRYDEETEQQVSHDWLFEAAAWDLVDGSFDGTALDMQQPKGRRPKK